MAPSLYLSIKRGENTVTDEEVREWAKKSPVLSKYLSNIEALKILYRRQVLGEREVAAGGRKYTQMNIKDLQPNQRVAVRGVVVEKETRTYQGCALCRRKSCEHDAGKQEYLMVSLLVADNTGSVWSHLSGEDNVSEGDEVVVYGRTKKFGDNIEINIDKVEKVASTADNAEQILKLVKKSGSMKKDIVEKMCARLNVNFKDIEPRLLIEGDTVKVRE
jgi:RecG-like helicase